MQGKRGGKGKGEEKGGAKDSGREIRGWTKENLPMREEVSDTSGSAGGMTEVRHPVQIDRALPMSGVCHFIFL